MGNDTQNSVQKVVKSWNRNEFVINRDVIMWMKGKGSELAEEVYSRDHWQGEECDYYVDDQRFRTDELLIQAVEEGLTESLEVVEVPEDVDWLVTHSVTEPECEIVVEKRRVFGSNDWHHGKANNYDDRTTEHNHWGT